MNASSYALGYILNSKKPQSKDADALVCDIRRMFPTVLTHKEIGRDAPPIFFFDVRAKENAKDDDVVLCKTFEYSRKDDKEDRLDEIVAHLFFVYLSPKVISERGSNPSLFYDVLDNKIGTNLVGSNLNSDLSFIVLQDLHCKIKSKSGIPICKTVVSVGRINDDDIRAMEKTCAARRESYATFNRVPVVYYYDNPMADHVNVDVPSKTDESSETRYRRVAKTVKHVVRRSVTILFEWSYYFFYLMSATYHNVMYNSYNAFPNLNAFGILNLMGNRNIGCLEAFSNNARFVKITNKFDNPNRTAISNCSTTLRNSLVYYDLASETPIQPTPIRANIPSATQIAWRYYITSVMTPFVFYYELMFVVCCQLSLVYATRTLSDTIHRVYYNLVALTVNATYIVENVVFLKFEEPKMMAFDLDWSIVYNVFRWELFVLIFVAYKIHRHNVFSFKNNVKQTFSVYPLDLLNQKNFDAEDHRNVVVFKIALLGLACYFYRFVFALRLFTAVAVLCERTFSKITKRMFG
jgi:hypothetical protein